LKLAEIWSEILETDNFDRDDNFLAIGGHSLKVMTMISMIYDSFEVELPLEVVFNNAVISKIADYIRNNNKIKIDKIVNIGQKEYYELSPAQRRIVYIEKYEDVKTTYHLTNKFMLNGVVDEERLNDAFMKLIKRHESLRTSFELHDDGFVQIINDEIDFRLTVISCREEEVDEYISSFIKPYNLEKAPLFRGALIKFNEEKSMIVLDLHHTIADGKSVRIILRDLLALYKDEPLPELKARYVDYTQWYNRLVQGKREEQEAYWQGVLKDYNITKGLMKDFEVSGEREYKGGKITEYISENLYNALNKLAVENHTTAFILLFAAYNVLYSKYTAKEDIVIGTPIEGRENNELKDMVGMFINSLAIRSYPEKEKTFYDYLTEMKDVVIGAFDNDEYQIDNILNELSKDSEVIDNNIFDVTFAMQYIDTLSEDIAGVEVDYLNENNVMEFENLRVIVYSYENTLILSLVYSKDLFRDETISQMMRDYLKILETITDNPYIKIKDINLTNEVFNDISNEEELDVGFSF